MALGVHAHVGPPAGGKFAGEALTGWDIDDFLPGEDLITAIKRHIGETVAAGGKIRFCVDDFDPVAALDHNSPHFESNTSQELRHVLANCPEDSVIFYRGGKEISRAELGI